MHRRTHEIRLTATVHEKYVGRTGTNRLIWFCNFILSQSCCWAVSFFFSFGFSASLVHSLTMISCIATKCCCCYCYPNGPRTARVSMHLNQRSMCGTFNSVQSLMHTNRQMPIYLNIQSGLNRFMFHYLFSGAYAFTSKSQNSCRSLCMRKTFIVCIRIVLVYFF